MLNRLIITLVVCGFLFTATAAQNGFDYPQPRKGDQVDDYHGVKVRDPYRWMEETESAETKSWIEAQNKLTGSYLSTIPQREKIKARLTELWNYERFSSPAKIGNYYIYSKNDGLQNQSVLYKANSINDPGTVFFDPNKLSADGTAALSGSSFTDDGKLWAYGVATAGSDRTEWKVMDVATGKLLTDTLSPNRQGGVSWLKDNSGFFYSSYPAAAKGSELKGNNFFQKFYFHKLGTPQSEDKVVYERPDNKEYFIGGRVTEDSKWLVISVGQGTSPKNMIYFKDLTKSDSQIMPLIDSIDANYSFIGNDNSVFYFRTNKDAARSRIVSVNVSEKSPKWKVIIPEAAETLQGVNFINDQFVLNYLKDAYTQIRIFDRSGKAVREVKLPGIGSAGGFGGKRFDTETFYSYSSYNAPPTIYRYDMKTGASTLFRQAKVNFDPSVFEVKQVFYPSKDGTKIPMFLVHKKGIKLDAIIRRSFMVTVALTFHKRPAFPFRALSGRKWAAFSRWQTFGAATSTARRGTKRAQNSRNKMFLTILSARENG